MPEPSVLKIATRSSALALAQANMIAAALEAAGHKAELSAMSTRGDAFHSTLADIGGKGLFTAELEAALRQGSVQLAVHSSKDLPADMADDMVIAAVPPREDARDALISPAGGLADLPNGARIGSSSPRRAVQVKLLRPDLQVLPLRGNVQTRLRKLREGQFEAIILAMAGIHRLGLTGELESMLHPLSIDDFIPAAGQGALAVQCMTADQRTRQLLAALNDPESEAALLAERSVIADLGAGCRSAVGIHIRRAAAGAPPDRAWRGDALVATLDGSKVIKLDVEAASADDAAELLTDQLEAHNARALLEP